jgi:hypothetical protein
MESIFGRGSTRMNTDKSGKLLPYPRQSARDPRNPRSTNLDLAGLNHEALFHY